MIRVVYFKGAEGSREGLNGHAGVQVVDRTGLEVAYITWATTGTIPERRWKILKSKWLAPLRVLQTGYGVTIDDLFEDMQNYSVEPLVVELPALTETQAGIDEEALLRWWWSFSQDLGEASANDGEVTYDFLRKNCTTISAMALLAGGMHHYTDMGAGTGRVGRLAPQKLRSEAFGTLWRPKMLYQCALNAKAKIDRINADAKKLKAILEREQRSAQKKARFFQAAAPGTMQEGVWTVEAWKKASKGSTRFSHRYQTLIDIDKALAAYHAAPDRMEETTKLYELSVAIHKQLVARPMSNRKPAILALGAQVYERLQVVAGVSVTWNKGSLAQLERNNPQERIGYRQAADKIMEEMQRTVEAATHTLDLIKATISTKLGISTPEEASRSPVPALENRIVQAKQEISKTVKKMEEAYGGFNLYPNPARCVESLQNYHETLRNHLEDFFDACAEVQELANGVEAQSGTPRGRRRSNAVIGGQRSRSNSGLPTPQPPSDHGLVEINLNDSDSEGWEEIDL